MRISDWSSDVCSSDLAALVGGVDTLYGISLSKQILGASFAAELSYRRNMPLNAAVLGIAPGLPEAGDTKGPRGNTVHGLVNLIGVIGNTPVFDSAAWTVEMTWNTYTHVRSGERSEEHTSELQSLMRISYAVFCLNKKTKTYNT